MLVDPVYDYTYKFSDGFATAHIEKREGTIIHVIDTSGNIYTKRDFPELSEIVSCTSFSEGMLLVKGKESLHNGFGFMNKFFELVIWPKYKCYGCFSEGLAGMYTENNRMVYIDKEENVIINAGSFECSNYFKEGLAGCVSPNEKMGFIDKSGTVVIEPIFGWVNDFSEGLAVVYEYQEDLSVGDVSLGGYINRDGEFVIEPKYINCGNFREGLAAVRIDKDRVGVIDKQGAMIIPTIYKEILLFKEGLMRVADSSSKLKYIDRDSKIIWEEK